MLARRLTIACLLVAIAGPFAIQTARAGTYSVTLPFTLPGGCVLCNGSANYSCFSGLNGGLSAKTFTDQTPGGNIVTSVTVRVDGVYSTTSLATAINGVSSAAIDPGQNFVCNACQMPQTTLA